MTEACQEYGSENVLAASFTRTAARELVRRDLPMNEEQIGTLHALCYRQMDRPAIISKTHLKDWNAEHPSWSFEGGAGSDLDDPYADPDAGGAKEGDRMAQDYQRLRGLMIPQEEWPVRVQWFADAWKDFKEQTHTVDFTDLIEMCLKERSAIPNGAAVFFLDEVQDFSPLELALARHWGGQAEKVYLAGDDDQCQPGDSQVLTTQGYVSMRDLNPSQHRLVSFDRTKSTVIGRKDGYAFEKAEREYCGRLLTVQTSSSPLNAARCTPNHRWLVKWDDKAKQPNVHVVYLMRKGSKFRIGWCRLFRADGGFHLGVRARLEEADGAWILRVCTERQEASLWESIISARYGIPTLPFREVAGASHYTASGIDFVFSQLPELPVRAFQCLSDHGRDIAFPIWTPQQAFARRGGASIIELEACNLLDELMQVPVMEGSRGVWSTIRVRKSDFFGTVYSLDVEKYHLYITHGMVTHNCLYRFKGAVPDTFLSPELPADQVQVLAQSYRIPRAVHAAAVRWIEGVAQRMPKAYQPRQADGVVETLPITYKYLAPLRDQLDGWLSEGKRVAFLASCAFFVDPVKHQLREWGVPFHNPYRKQRGDWNPLAGRAGTVTAADRLLAFRQVVDMGRWWTYRDLWAWAAALEADGVFARGAKTAMRRKAEDDATAALPVETSDLEMWMPSEETAEAATNGDVDWLQSKVLTTYQKPMAYAGTVLQMRGSAGLTTRPLVSIGTIHSYKGGEADVVILFPDLSPAGYREWVTPGEAQDSVRRCFYVGQTRARECLYWAQPSGLSISGYL